MTTRLDDFRVYRERMNECILDANHLRHAIETIDLLRAESARP